MGAEARETAASHAEIKRLAQEFEALLMTQMLREMRQSMVDEDEQDLGFGASTMSDTSDVELGRALTRAGGLGLTDALLRAFEAQIATRRDSGATATRGEATLPVATVAPVSVGPAETERHESRVSAPQNVAANVTATAPISSGFGWRRDPITGSAKFHQGIDIAAAYGADVRAAAEGRVAFAGTQKGYGQTVILDHADGRQTRYAHLSQQLVHAGDLVTEGQVLGKSGNSGRTTGAHLHFEMLVHGRPVDPRITPAE